TAKRLGLTLPIVVLDDRWLALIKVKQIRRQFPLYGTELQAEDYREPPAHYFGVPAVGVRDAEALEAAVTKGLAASGPTGIEAVGGPGAQGGAGIDQGGTGAPRWRGGRGRKGESSD